ncbi:MAG: CvpA family protein [Dehalococcoidia bacterium]|nr:CvpA family protein [Dehalococcoidia bacterium]
MNWLDIVIIIILVISVIGGLRSGLIRSVLSLAGLIIGVVLAGRFYTALAERLFFVPQDGIAKVVAFIIILVVVMVVAAILGAIITRAASALVLGWLNHLGGGAFGLIMSGIVIAALLAVWVKFMGMSGPIKGSTIAPLLLDRFPLVLSLLPEDFGSIRRFFGGSVN